MNLFAAKVKPRAPEVWALAVAHVAPVIKFPVAS